jgi:4-amino-4-deoxy-L-arabinose transferase-like glycosyltransferase
MFNDEFGGQASWLIPSALVLLAFGVLLTRRVGRTDVQRASLVIWGGTLVLTGLVFSFATGIIHPYYTMALVTSIGATVGIGAHLAWVRRSALLGRVALAAALVTAGIWSFVLLDRTSSWLPWLRVVVVVCTLLAAALVVGLPRLTGRLAVLVAGIGLVGALGGSTAYALDTTRVAHSGAIPSAGPSGQGSSFGPGGGHGVGGVRPGGQGGVPTTGLGRGGSGGGGFGGGFGGGGFGGGTGGPGGQTGTRTAPFGSTASGRHGGFGGMGGAGSLLGSTTPSAALTAALKTGSYTWAAATVGSNSAAGYQLASGRAVMAIGGFNGTDPAPSLAQFEKYVAAGKIHYFIPGVSFGGGSGTSDVASQITTWVESHYTATTIGGTTVYDLTATG